MRERDRKRIANRVVRKLAGCRNPTQRIDLVDGFERPAITGESWHYETRGGTRIHHPGAYSKSGWSNMIYCSSTRRLEVGKEFYEVVVDLTEHLSEREILDVYELF